MSDHPDIEALSAHLDGQAPEWAAHLAGCRACRAQLARFRAVSEAVGAPVPLAPPAVRDRAVARALDEAGSSGPSASSAPPLDSGRPAATGGPAKVVPMTARRRGPGRWLAGCSAAAVALVAVAAAALLVRDGGPSGDHTVAAGGPAARQEPSAGPSADAATTDVVGGDLGDVGDAATLLARAAPALAGRRAAPEAASRVGASAAPDPPSAVVGTLPCEMEARSRNPSLRELVYSATARSQGTAAVVLGFATGPGPAPVSLVVLARDGCRVLLEAVAP